MDGAILESSSVLSNGQRVTVSNGEVPVPSRRFLGRPALILNVPLDGDRQPLTLHQGDAIEHTVKVKAGSCTQRVTTAARRHSVVAKAPRLTGVLSCSE